MINRLISFCFIDLFVSDTQLEILATYRNKIDAIFNQGKTFSEDLEREIKEKFLMN